MPLLPKKTFGCTHAEEAHNRTVDYLKSVRPMRGAGINTRHTPFGVSRTAAASKRGGNAGWFWKPGQRLYAPTLRGAMVNQVVKVLNSDSIVTTGIVCAGGVLKKATPGKFVALKPSPVLKNDGTDDPRHIPQLPMPGGPDPDNENNFWEYFGPAEECFGGDSVEV